MLDTRGSRGYNKLMSRTEAAYLTDSPAVDLQSVEIDCDDAYAQAQEIYAARKGEIAQDILEAWYEGAMEYATEMPSLRRPSSEAPHFLQRAFYAGTQGRIPGYLL